MKISLQKASLKRAFTFVEMMISSSLMVLVLGGIVGAHITGMKMMQITRAKLGASDEARKALSRLTDEVRAARWLEVGNGTSGSFTSIKDGDPQQGNGVEIYSTEKKTPYVRYYRDPTDHMLKRISSDEPTAEIIAQNITNNVVFAFENSFGQMLTNSENNRVLAVTLQFYQIQYPIVKVGPGEFYDFYQLRTRITRRTLE
ncbi:MAG: PilW family protein [Limisphaerales bacterium]